MKKNILLLLLVAFIFSTTTLVSATAIIDNNYDLKLSCVSMNCSKVNITISYPNSTILINNKPMTNNIYYVNYTLIPKVNGRYDYIYSDGINSSEGYFITTPTGEELNISQMLLYLLIGSILILLFILCIYGGLSLPFANERNQNEEVIAINWKKYLNVFCWAASYMFLIAIVFVAYNLIYAYSQWGNLVIFFRYLYRLLIILILPVLVGIFLVTIINLFNDQKINAFIKKMGLPYNG